MQVHINPMPPALNPTLLARFGKVSPPTVGHILNFGFVSPAISPLFRPVRLVGRAITVQISGPDSMIVHKVTEMLEPGDVVVVDTCGDHVHACWGEMVTRAAMSRKAGGAIIDGMATDRQEVIGLEFPVYCRGTSALTTKVYGIDGKINVPIQCGGVPVQPGDLVVADENGVLIMGPQVAAGVIEQAEKIEAQEASLRIYLADGGSLAERSGANRLLHEKFRLS